MGSSDMTATVSHVGGGIFLYKPVTILPSEYVSREANVHHQRGRWTWSFGRLYLTNFRLIFCGAPALMIWLMAVPWPREAIVLDLDEIVGVTPATQSPWHILGDAFAVYLA